jgi:hypothetical protein
MLVPCTSSKILSCKKHIFEFFIIIRRRKLHVYEPCYLKSLSVCDILQSSVYSLAKLKDEGSIISIILSISFRLVMFGSSLMSGSSLVIIGHGFT